MAFTAVSHPAPLLILLHIYVVSVSLHRFASCFTASQLFASHLMQAKRLENFGATLFISVHPLTTLYTQCRVSLCSHTADPT